MKGNGTHFYTRLKHWRNNSISIRGALNGSRLPRPIHNLPNKHIDVFSSNLSLLQAMVKAS